MTTGVAVDEAGTGMIGDALDGMGMGIFGGGTTIEDETTGAGGAGVDGAGRVLTIVIGVGVIIVMAVTVLFSVVEDNVKGMI